MAVRDKVYKVRLSSEEVEMLKSANVLNIAKFMRDSSLNVVNKRKDKQVYSKLDRDFILELSRIGGNINQIAKALNTDFPKLFSRLTNEDVKSIGEYIEDDYVDVFAQNVKRLISGTPV